MRNRTYGGVRGRKTKVGRKLLRFPPTRLIIKESRIHFVWLERLLIAFFSRKRLKNKENASKIAEKVGICVKNKLIV